MPLALSSPHEETIERPCRAGADPMRMLVTVVIPALNVADTLADQLEALSRQTFEGAWEVVIADNGSSDATRDVAMGYRGKVPNLRIVDASGRRGINHARNAGASAGCGDFILFCDGDDVVESRWVGEMTAVLATCDAVGGAVERGLLNGRGLMSPALPKAMRRGGMFAHPIGANCGVRKNVWQEVGGFNEDYANGAADEVEFFWRLALAGHQVKAVPAAVVHYRLREDVRSMLRKNYRTGHEQVRLHRDFAGTKHRGTGCRSVIRSWAWLALTAPRALIDRSRRALWLRRAARSAGRLVGSLRYRTLYL